MRVLYDYQILSMQKYGGISRYFFELIRNLKNNYEKDDFVVKASLSSNYYFSEEIPQRQLKHGSRYVNYYSSLIEILMPHPLKGKYDILHPTYYYADYLFDHPELKKKAKIVITVHDMIHEKYFMDDKYTIECKKKMIDMADGIIAISQQTRDDLVDIYPVAKQKPIEVIYHGNSLTVESKPIDLPDKYILFVGGRTSYKNFDLLIEAFSEIHREFPNVYLIATGSKFSSEEIEVLKKYGLKDVVRSMEVEDTELAYLYEKAICFVYPSVYEGFGLPILEAFNYGCPVILMNASCFPEIAGDAACYFSDKYELVGLIKHLISSEELREEYIGKGYIRLKEFSWKKTADKTYDFYRRVCESF